MLFHPGPADEDGAEKGDAGALGAAERGARFSSAHRWASSKIESGSWTSRAVRSRAMASDVPTLGVLDAVSPYTSTGFDGSSI